MKQFMIRPKILEFEDVENFLQTFKIGKNDLVFISDRTLKKSFQGSIAEEAVIIDYRQYVKGEPTDMMVENIAKDLEGIAYKRVFAIGGGTILDVAKLFALKKTTPVVELFNKELPIEKAKELILIPTTCGTGSEVTNISILELTAISSKFGLAVDELFADYAVLIPELLKDLPMSVFATSSIDALIHATESYTSPKATNFSQLYSLRAIEMILKGYQKIAAADVDKRQIVLNNEISNFLIASTFAGIAFSNAGCAAVHAMSYPLGAVYHIPHGEANYLMFTEVYKTYQAIDPDGQIKNLNQFLSEILTCNPNHVYDVLEVLLNTIITKKKLREYGVTKNDIQSFTNSVMTKQTRLMANNYVELSEKTIGTIYEKLY
ncbi:4-hydroxybutyrate dehydrogenase [Eubacteriaceae bacterium ES2]|nr:4-hydroxybutyrate dehydrogenase [Eubacteriaceae bacterium ES2]